jgi:predicted permease
MLLKRLQFMIPLRLRSLFRRNRVEAELDEELRFHLEYQVQENLARGLPPGEARREALLAIGGIEQRKEECRDTRGIGALTDFHKDFAFAGRTLFRRPAFALTAAITIALGIGAGTTVFSVVNSVLLRPLPFRDENRLVLVLRESPSSGPGALGSHNFLYSNADFMDIRSGTHEVFEDVGGIASFRAYVPRRDGSIEQVSKALVTVNFFGLLGARAAMGRDFTNGDAAPIPSDALIPTGTAAILSYRYWQDRFGADPGVIGRELPGSAPGGPRIVGVLAPGFRLYFGSPAWVDAEPDFFVANNGGYDVAHRNLLLAGAIGRLRPGITIEQARGRLQALSPEILKTTFEPESRLSVESMRGRLVRQVRPAIVALMGSVLFLLWIACANVANLLLVQAGRRQRELAVRAALGGGVWRLLRQLLAEALLLSAVGSLAGIGLAWAGIRAVVHLAPANLPRIESTSIDWRVLAFVAACGLSAAAVFGCLPAWHAVRPDIADILRGGGQSHERGTWMRNAVVVLEVALSFVLLTGSGLMFRSFLQLERVNPGFDPHHLLTFSATRAWPLNRQAGRLELLHQMQSALRAIPGVQSVSAGLFLPLTRGSRAERPPARQSAPEPAGSAGADFQQALPGYFETLRTPLLAGRVFTEQDNAPGHLVVIIDRTLEERAFPHESAIGKRILVQFPDTPSAEVIGVAEAQRADSLSDSPRPTIYFPEGAVGIGVSRTWAIRAAGDPAALVPSIRAALAKVDPAVVISKVQTMDALVDTDRVAPRFSLVLLAFFAFVAAALAGVGIYGVLASSVRQRTAEIGLRIALGAAPASILRIVIGRGLALAGAGVVAGLAAAWGLTRALSSLLVDVQPTDPATFAAVTAVFLAIAALASWLPARRAASLDPSQALRSE